MPSSGTTAVQAQGAAMAEAQGRSVPGRGRSRKRPVGSEQRRQGVWVMESRRDHISRCRVWGFYPASMWTTAGFEQRRDVLCLIFQRVPLAAGWRLDSGERGGSRQTGQEALAAVQARGDDGSDQGAVGGVVEKRPDSGSLLIKACFTPFDSFGKESMWPATSVPHHPHRVSALIVGTRVPRRR